MAQDKQAKIAPEEAWEKIVSDAKDAPNLLPKLRFGNDKLDEVTVDLVVDEEKPRSITFDDPYNGGKEGKAWAINVRILSGSEAGSMRALIFPSNVEHGLTRGVLAIAKKHGSRLKGVGLRIETKNYNNKRFKTKTRGYNVSEITPPSNLPA